uniref:Uncharacterized protein n=1 Tax=Candidatus Kentrum sp. FW TaxID=2126338 RepID=A0A450T460_9GAMM|nr:MAG: hypothetical protein BECKFW1821B_GA0114236_106517 [Candidatus Kentron sp. FW]
MATQLTGVSETLLIPLATRIMLTHNSAIPSFMIRKREKSSKNCNWIFHVLSHPQRAYQTVFIFMASLFASGFLIRL